MIIPEVVINEIKEKVNIVDVIGQYIRLEKRGNNFFGKCPFHDDNNPSLSVSQSKRFYKCFSCGAKGDVIKFISDFEKIPYIQAIKKAAYIANVELNITDFNEDLVEKKYFEIMQEAKNFFKVVLNNTTEGKEALNYLTERGISKEITERFNIGLASSKENLLFTALTKEKNRLPLDLIELGLVKVRNNNEYYDLFRNRIVFPITNNKGKTVGFSGRIYRNYSLNESKYINSPETSIFKKSNILYNFYESSNEIRVKKNVFIFEGFMDVIAAYKAGINNTVATMGTALTKDHVYNLKKITSSVTLCFDGDEAGIEATKKAIKIFTEANFEINAVLIPDHLDPDEYLKKYGEKALYKILIEDQTNVVEYLFKIYSNNIDYNNINSIEKFKISIFDILKIYNSNTINEIYIKKISKLLNLDFNTILLDFNKHSSFKIKEKVPEKIITKKNYSIESYKVGCANSEKNLIVLAFSDKSDCSYIMKKLDNRKVLSTNREILCEIENYWNLYKFMDKTSFISKYLNPNLVDEFECILKNFSFGDKTKENKIPIEKLDNLINHVIQYSVVEKIFNDENLSQTEKIIQIKKIIKKRS